MKDFLKRVRADFMLSSILCIALGIVFVAWPEKMADLIGTVLAIIMIVIGAVYLCSFFFHVVTNRLSAAMGAIVLLLGVWVLVQPDIVLTLIPIVIGVVLLVHGLRGFRESLDAKKYGYNSWGIGAAFAIISIVLGVICVVNAFGVVKLAFWGIGAALIYNGISDIYIACSTSHAEKNYRKNAETIDVEFVDDEK